MTEQEQIKEAFEDLLKSLRKETSKENRQKIKEAFEFANEAHKGVKRRSGEPYILHPLAVAKIAVQRDQVWGRLLSSLLCCMMWMEEYRLYS